MKEIWKDVPGYEGLYHVNNLVDNLEWCSHKYNMNYGTKVKRQKEKVSKPVCQYTLNEVFIKEYPSRKEASIETGTDVTGICQCIKGKLKTSGGFIWKNGRKL